MFGHGTRTASSTATANSQPDGGVDARQQASMQLSHAMAVRRWLEASRIYLGLREAPVSARAVQAAPNLARGLPDGKHPLSFLSFHRGGEHVEP